MTKLAGWTSTSGLNWPKVSFFDFEFRFRLRVSISSFDFEFRFRVSISSFDFEFRFRVSISSLISIFQIITIPLILGCRDFENVSLAVLLPRDRSTELWLCFLPVWFRRTGPLRQFGSDLLALRASLALTCWPFGPV